MKDSVDSIKSKTSDVLPEMQSKPQGIGMAVAFDWGLAAQFLVTPLLPLVLGIPSMFKQFSPVVGALVSSLVTLPLAALLAVFGEGVRRGWRWTRPIQLGANALGFLGGLATLVSVWNGAKQGNYWSVVTATILLIFSPLIAWRMSRPQTKRWFDTVSSSQARKRHGGAWPLLIALWALVGGILQALAVIKR